MSANVRTVSYSDNGGAAATGVTMTEPSGTVQGDVLMMVLYVDGGGGGYTPSADFTQRYGGNSQNSQFIWRIETCVRGASPPALTWSWTSAVFEAHLFAVSGANTTIDSLSADGGTGAQAPSPHNPDPPATTVTGAGTLVVAGGMNRGGSDPSPWTASSGYTVISENTTGRRTIVEKKIVIGSGDNPGAVSGAISADRDWWDGFTMSFADSSQGLSVLSGEPMIGGTFF